MAKKIAINGFGRIGRITFRNLFNVEGIEIVGINDLTDNATLAHLLKRDSAHGTFEAEVKSTDDHIIVDGKKIVATAIRNPAELPWAELGVDLVLECTGVFTNKEKMELHRQAGAKKVLLSAPAKGSGVKTIVLGVNDKDLNADDLFVSNASCTTNCLAPLMKVVIDNWGLVQGSMTTTHAYTSDQNIQDSPHKDLRRARAAAYNIVPTSTGAADAVGLVLPGVTGKLFAMALRVPIITGSLVELNILVEKELTIEEINKTFKRYADNEMKGILEYVDDAIVSSDIVRNPHSSIFDSQLTDAKGKMIKLVSWYDNEAGYSARLSDLAKKI